MTIRYELKVYKVALFVTSFALGILFMAYVRLENQGCKVHNLRPVTPSCYSWSDGYVQCNKPKEIDV